MILGLNHITLAVSDLERSLCFYRDLLGLRPVARTSGTVYLTAGELWLALVRDEATRSNPSPDYTHIAFSVSRDQFGQLSEAIRRSRVTIWQENETEGESLYFLDPDGHKLEIHASDLDARLRALSEEPPEDFELL